MKLNPCHHLGDKEKQHNIDAKQLTEIYFGRVQKRL